MSEQPFDTTRTRHIYRRAHGRYKYIKTMTLPWSEFMGECYRLERDNRDGEYFDLECIAAHMAINSVPSNQPYMD
jgi:hypothetical protein